VYAALWTQKETFTQTVSIGIIKTCFAVSTITTRLNVVVRHWHSPTIVYCPADDTVFEVGAEICCSGMTSSNYFTQATQLVLSQLYVQHYTNQYTTMNHDIYSWEYHNISLFIEQVSSPSKSNYIVAIFTQLLPLITVCTIAKYNSKSAIYLQQAWK